MFGTREPKAGAVRSLYELCDDRRLNHRVEITEGVLGDACAQRLTQFFREARARKRTLAVGGEAK